ncbi:IS30 family transposase [Luteimicrobium subarcticum]|uniref:IS30 family transposase n=1 Tax=Luteimicrobium subarcticum TaxID=620910 RepID=UPI003CCB88AE
MGFTVEQEHVLWERWRAGDSARLIARTIGSNLDAVRRFLSATGGVRPAARRRSPRHLSSAEREEISRGIAAGLSARAIAERIGRPSSTVSREISRNGGREAYRAATADAAAWDRARRPRPSRLASSPALLALVRGKLDADWSPQQIAMWLRHQHPHDASRRVSHETIYRSIYVSGRRELGPAQARRLRSGRSVRRPRGKQQSHGRGRLRNMVSIHHRPAVVAERAEVGHWEGDLVMGSRPSAVATLVDRSTRFVRVVPLPDGIKADAVRRALIRNLSDLPPALRRSLTWDRGREMAEHQELAAELGMDVYFCDPRSPWQRPSNENTNRLLRQYLPKRTDLRPYSARDLDDIAHRINTRPRQVLDWSTSHDLFWPLLLAARGADVNASPAGVA